MRTLFLHPSILYIINIDSIDTQSINLTNRKIYTIRPYYWLESEHILVRYGSYQGLLFSQSIPFEIAEN